MKTNKFLDEIPSISKEEKEKVKKKLLVLNTLKDSLKEQYKKADTGEKKRVLKQVALGTTIKNIKLSDYGYEQGTWNFFEASFPADGVDGAIKRKLDQRVSYGHDITNAEEAYSFLLDNVNVEIHYFSETNIEQMNQIILNVVVPVKGTMTLHHIIYDRQNKHTIYYKTLSCICDENEPCVYGEDMKQHDLVQQQQTNERENMRLKQKREENTQSSLALSADDRTKSNSKKKITILSLVKLTPKDLPLLPLQLNSINKDFDISTGHDLRHKSEILTTQKRQNVPKRRNEIDKKKPKESNA
ncbi:unnamed protein product [Parnassius apollo]|uniref:(apollo) hypothetical protein n=1 Tax=Parnassius apollo TaxID=110799 RepID=A0A8S3Y5L0_PARAO|nr:unnamed protein product [Parnassius apollo]